MPVTKTAKRALRGSLRKGQVNTLIRTKLDLAIRVARKSKKGTDVVKAISLADIAAKKEVIHKNKAARVKKSLAKLAQTPAKTKTAAKKKTSTKK